MQPKLDTRGQAYILALQHLLTGLYIGELALIGFFGLRTATGPFVIAIVLFLSTIAFNALMNKYLAPLEQFLPTELASSAASEQTSEEATPLLRPEVDEEARVESQIQRLAQRAHAPAPIARHVLGPMARFFEPHVFASYEAMRRWLREGCDYPAGGHDAAEVLGEDDVPVYSEDQLRKAYLNPALTSPTPPIWLARDDVGVSGVEVAEI